VYLRKGQSEEARRLLEEAANVLENLIKDYPDDAGLREARVENACLRASLEKQHKNKQRENDLLQRKSVFFCFHSA